VRGVRAQGPDGAVEFNGPVVLATSTYDWDPELVQELVGLGPDDFGSVAPRSVRGDGIRLARGVGAAVVQAAGHLHPDAARLEDHDRRRLRLRPGLRDAARDHRGQDRPALLRRLLLGRHRVRAR
jgi:hypothetical protein